MFITSSYDATTHFETTCDDVLSLFEKITGTPFDFSAVQASVETVEQWWLLFFILLLLYNYYFVCVCKNNNVEVCTNTNNMSDECN